MPSALVIGAMVPDFRHLIPGLQNLGTHTIAALLWFSLPVGSATYALFQTALRAPALAALPLSVRQRLGPFIRPTSARVAPPLAAVALCVLVGAVSHLAWDELTHRETFVTDTFRSVFWKTMWGSGRHRVVLYELLQVVSSVLGFVLLVVWCLRWLAAQPLDETIGLGASPLAHTIAVVLLFFVPTTALIVRFVLMRARLPLRDAIAAAVWQAGRAFAVGTLVGAIIWNLRHRRAAK